MPSLGSAAHVLRDRRTFVDVDIPALLSWSFDASAAVGVRYPVPMVFGIDHGPLFRSVRTWRPQAEQVTIAGPGHDVALAHLVALADVLVAFLRRHPIG